MSNDTDCIKMCEQTVNPKQNDDGDSGDSPASDNEGAEMEVVEVISSEEFHVLNNQLDGLNSALDFIEQKNDDIHSKLLALLKASRDVRQELAQEAAQQGSDSKADS